MMQNQAKVIADFGKSYLVEEALTSQIYQAKTRSKKVDYACGDLVKMTILNKQQAVIEEYYPRKNLLYRADLYKSKILAANLNQLLFVVAVEPCFNENLLQRAMLAAESMEIKFIIILNKIDIENSLFLKKRLQYYQDIGYLIVSLSAIQEVNNLKSILYGKTSILVGQSGVGKSTIINGLLEKEIAKVNTIAGNLHTGKHTTTHTVMYSLNKNSFVIDSPGLQKFGVHYIAIHDLIRYFPEFQKYIGQCRFHNCAHQKEPGCALRERAAAGELSEHRLLFLQEIIQENSQKTY